MSNGKYGAGDMSSLIAALQEPLNPAVVKKKRGAGGRELDYIETSYAIRRANELFGFFSWGHEILDLRLVGEDRVVGRDGKERWEVGYLCHVRITVRTSDAGCPIAHHDGEGFGSNISVSRIEAHGTAAKAAESDAIKRALRCFGDQFGLSLYDDGAYLNVHQPRRQPLQDAPQQPAGLDAQRPLGASHVGLPQDMPPKVREFVAGLLEAIKTKNSRAELQELWNDNITRIDALGQWRPIVVNAVNQRLREIADAG